MSEGERSVLSPLARARKPGLKLTPRPDTLYCHRNASVSDILEAPIVPVATDYAFMTAAGRKETPKSGFRTGLYTQHSADRLTVDAVEICTIANVKGRVSKPSLWPRRRERG